MIARRRAWLSVVGAVALLALHGSAAVAQSTPMRFIVGLAPGGAVDPYARIIAEHMAKTLGRTIIVENRPGAGGNISAQIMTDAPADGTLIWVGTQALTEINPNVYSNLRWSIDDFLPLIKGVQAPLVLVAHPSVPASNFAEFVAWAKANRGKLTYSSYTAGTPSHLLGFLLNEKFDLDLTHVPYRGSGLQVTGLVAGHSLFGFAQVNSSAPQYAAASSRRSASPVPSAGRR
jgi:tripartite-type tricarboxylate transporter receptor subunit TctC